MPTTYPFPHVARIALSFLVSVKRVDSVPRIVEVQPWKLARLNDSFAGIYNCHVDGYEGI